MLRKKPDGARRRSVENGEERKLCNRPTILVVARANPLHFALDMNELFRRGHELLGIVDVVVAALGLSMW